MRGMRIGCRSEFTKCTRSAKWVHKRCSGERGNLSRVRVFVCKICMRGGRMRTENSEENGVVSKELMSSKN